MSQEDNYIFHTKTQILKTKENRVPMIHSRTVASAQNRLRLTNEHYNYTHTNKNQNQDLKNLRYSLYRPKDQQSLVKERLIKEWDNIVQNNDLVNGVTILKDLKLLNQKTINQKKVLGKNHVRFIYNDYHQKFTNPGYSRNNLGCYYTR